jgi:phage terminase small subunit
MPVLRNPRHEAFACAIFRGIFEPDLYPTQGAAYAAAGYTSRNIGKPGGSAEAAASQLLKKVKILDRVRELQAQAADQVKETIDKCVAELNEDRRDAKAQGQHSAAISAVMGKAKLLGLVTEKHEDVTGKPDFSKATSLNDVGIKLLQSVGYAEPSPADVALALEAHERFTATLEAIAERAQGCLISKPTH